MHNMKRLFTLMVMLAAVVMAGAQDRYTVKKDIPYVSNSDTSAYR